MQITEPMTMLTDYALGAVCLWTGMALFYRAKEENQISMHLWTVGLFATALMSFTGGTFHGFTNYLGMAGNILLWKATVFMAGFVSFFMLSATFFAAFRGRARMWFIVLAFFKLGIYSGWMIGHDEFYYVIIDYAPSMLLVAAVMGWLYVKESNPAAVWILGAIAISFMAGAIQWSEFALHEHFNHNDLYHVIQMGAIWLFFKGGKQLRDCG